MTTLLAPQFYSSTAAATVYHEQRPLRMKSDRSYVQFEMQRGETRRALEIGSNMPQFGAIVAGSRQDWQPRVEGNAANGTAMSLQSCGAKHSCTVRFDDPKPCYSVGAAGCHQWQ